MKAIQKTTDHGLKTKDHGLKTKDHPTIRLADYPTIGLSEGGRMREES